MPSDSKVEAKSLNELLSAVAAEDRSAFAPLYEASSAKLFGVVLRILRNRQQAEEVLQEVYIRIWRRAADYRPEKGTPMTWMITIARNRALDRRRQQKPELPLDEAEGYGETADSTPSPLAQTIAGEEGRALAACLEELGDEQRGCITLAYREGFTHGELAARFDTPLGTVKSWIHRGLRQLKKGLSQITNPNAS